MRSEWREVRLGEVCNIRRGSSPRPIVNYLSETDGMPWVKIADATASSSRYIEKTNQFIREEGVCRSVIVEKGDLILSNSGTAGLPKFMSISACIHDGWQVLKDLNGISSDFLYYTLLNIRLFLLHNAYDSTMKNLTLDMVRDASIKLPPLPEQKAIAHILGSLDDKIELNRKMNETLEEIARAIFKSWFVDFDPVRAKSEDRQPEGIDAETATLFPDSFEESELGLIPKGWVIKSLDQVVDVNPKRKLVKGLEAPYLDMKNMPTVSARAISVYPREFKSGTKFVNGNTLVARITPCLENGKTAFVDFLNDEEVGWGSTEYIVLQPKPPIPCEYAYFLARTDDFRGFAISNMSGTSGRQRVPVDCLSHYKIAVATGGVLQAFGRIASDTFKMMKALDEESASLAESRDSLLSKILSGEIRIKDAEKFVEKVL